MKFFIFDIESYPKFFSIVYKEYLNDKINVITSDEIKGMQKIINMLPIKDLVFAGFNIKGYDLPILECIIRGMKMYPNDATRVAEEAYSLSQRIIRGENVRFTYSLCSFTDLQDDLVLGTSLKTYESNKGRAIEETKVPFGTINLTSSQKQEIIQYNIQDVLGTEAILTDRFEYVKTKINIANKFGLDQYGAMKRTIASLSADVLVGNTYNKQAPAFLNDAIKYTLHPKIKDYVLRNLPKWVVDKFTSYSPESELVDRDFSLFDNFVTIGEGGAHSVHVKNNTRANYVLSINPKRGRILAIIDISSYYPNTALTFDYQSRSVKDKEVFRRLVDEKNKLSPIAKGPNSTKEVKEALTAVKALINATVGAYKQQFNKLYDPQQNVNVCFTGQLLILALANELYEKAKVDIVQVNTDGIILEFDDDKAAMVKSIIRNWENITGLNFDATLINRLWQNNVNNYIMETTNGKLKVKGRWLDPTLNPFNNLFFRVIKKAVFDYLVHGKDIATTIRDEQNPLMFLYTVKTGGTYDATILSTSRGDVTLGKVNRIYASTDRVHGGTFYKQKGQSRGLVPDCPSVAKTYNEVVVGLPKDIDYAWYIDKAERMLNSLVKVEL